MTLEPEPEPAGVETGPALAEVLQPAKTRLKASMPNMNTFKDFAILLLVSFDVFCSFMLARDL